MARRPRRPRANSASGTTPRVTIRHYCQGIGDCHLLTFPGREGEVFRILIDCGIHNSVTGGPAIMKDIVADVKKACDGKIDLLVVTHEHTDHISAFLTAADIFKTIEIGEVWMAWTEEPGDPLAEELDKYKGQAIALLQAVGNRLQEQPQMSKHLSAVRDGLDHVLGFQFGVEGDRVRSARNAAAKLGKSGKPTYLEPTDAPRQIDALPGVRIYVLGPPRDKALLKLEERASEMYHFDSAMRHGWPLERALSAGLGMIEDANGVELDEASPFDPNIGTELSAIFSGEDDGDAARFVREYYVGEGNAEGGDSDQGWRRIDMDWMAVAADLALQLDTGVNNTSLVLAFEFTDNNRVLLFPGDAQIGNWLSWEGVKWTVDDATVTANDLLARTIYLKVSHHGSHNGLPKAKGLELMTNADLSAFIPTNKVDAVKVRWRAMPFDPILDALHQRASGRVIRADDGWIRSSGKPQFAVPSGSILAVRNDGGPWVELDIA